MKKNIYILSDAHLGSLAIPHGRMQERRLVRFLDDIKHKAAAIYLLGDDVAQDVHIANDGEISQQGEVAGAVNGGCLLSKG